MDRDSMSGSSITRSGPHSSRHPPPWPRAAARAGDVASADAALAGEGEDPLRARVDGLVDRVPEARDPLARGPHPPRDLRGLLVRREQLRALLRSAEDDRA